MKYNESKPFSNGTEYEDFLYKWCVRCTHYKVRHDDDGRPVFSEDDGCQVFAAMERARFNINVFPRRDIVEERDDNGNIVNYHKCPRFYQV